MAKEEVSPDDECPSYETAIAEDRKKEVGAADAFEQILEHIGAGGRWQLKLFFFLSGVGVFFAFNNFGAAFLAATPTFWCIPPYIETVHIANETSSLDISAHDASKNTSTTPFIFNPLMQLENACEYYDLNYDQVENLIQTNSSIANGTTKSQCTNWYYDQSVFKSTIVTEWDLVCNNRWKMTLTQSTYMMGMMFGGIFLSELSDMYGRRTISLLSTVVLVISNISVGFSHSYGIMIALRFITAVAGTGMFLPNFVILMEILGLKYRGNFGVLYQLFFGIGICILPGIAYFAREWRHLSFAVSVPSLLLLLNFWLIPESPRWLLHKGREAEALKILKEAAKVNGGKLPANKELHFLLSSFKHEKHGKESILTKVADFFKNQAILVRTKNMRRRCLIIFFAWFVVSMVYYGLAFSGGNIDASVYLVVFLSGIVEIPSYFIVAHTVKRFGRRINLVITFFFCGAACMLILAVPKDLVWLNLTLVSVGKFFNASAFAVAYIYSAELVPTEVRNIAVGTSCLWARIGSAVTPPIVDGLGVIHYTIPSTVFGILSLLAGTLAFLLPETGNKKLPESIEEVESMKR